jgi:hypothetical protein
LGDLRDRFRALACVHPAYFIAIQQHCALTRFEQAADRSEKRSLASPIRAYEAYQFAFVSVQIDLIKQARSIDLVYNIACFESSCRALYSVCHETILSGCLAPTIQKEN